MEEGNDQPPRDVSSPVPPTVSEPQRAPSREGHKHRKMILLVSGGAVLALLLLGGGYWFLLRDKEPAPTAANGKEQTEQTPAPAPADPTPVQYKSTKLNVEITHRKDWTAKESSTGEITVTSPKISYAGADGQAKIGVFTLKIRKGATDAMKASVEKAVAPRDSEVIAYAAPTEQQRQYTNLSYAGTKDTFNFFIVTGNTELKAGNAFAYMLAMDGEFYLIAGGYGADKNNSLSFDSVPKDTMDSEALTQALDVVKSLKIY